MTPLDIAEKEHRSKMASTGGKGRRKKAAYRCAICYNSMTEFEGTIYPDNFRVCDRCRKKEEQKDIGYRRFVV